MAGAGAGFEETFASPGGRVPLPIKALQPLLQRLPQSTLLAVVALARAYLVGSVSSSSSGEAAGVGGGAAGASAAAAAESAAAGEVGLDAEVFQSLAESLKIDLETLTAAFTGSLTLLRLAVRQRVKTADFAKDMEALKFPEWFSAAFQKVLGEIRDTFEPLVVRNGIRYPTLADVRWRVDVTISSNALNRVLQPTVLMELTDSTGKTRTFEMSAERFHELRHSTAKLLSNMESVEQLAILKITS